MTLVLAIDALAVAVTLVLAVTSPGWLTASALPWSTSAGGLGVVDRWPAAGIAGLLIGAAAAYGEVARRAERIRRTVGPSRVVNFATVWTVGAVLSVPPIWAVVVTVAVYLHLWLRLRSAGARMYRTVLNTATMVIAAASASAATDGVRSASEVGSVAHLGAVVTAIVVFGVVQQSLTVAVVVTASPPQHRPAARRVSREDYLLELSTLCLGAMAAAVMVWHPLLVVLVPAPLVVLARAALVRELRQALEHDHRTGLLTEQAWRQRAEQLLATPGRRWWERAAQETALPASRRRGGADGPAHWPARHPARARPRATPRTAPRVIGCLMVDVDHFKAVNDTFGHLVGDVVLREVAAAVGAAVRSTDLVARAGGDELLVLLVDDRGNRLDQPTAVVEVAGRVRDQVAALQVQVPTPDGPLSIGQVTVSVGAAAMVHISDPVSGGPDNDAELGGQLAELIGAADVAMYRAKRGGRNRVRHADSPI